MEKVKRNFNEMYMYVNSGETIYDLLEKYTGEKDFSAAGIINFFRRNLNLQQNDMESETTRKKFLNLVNTYNKDINGKLVDSMLKNMTVQEKEELIKRFQAVNPEKYDFPNILTYINFLEEANFSRKALILDRNDDNIPPVLNPEIEELNQILIETAVAKADPELVSRIKNVLIHMVLMPYAKKQILKENPERDETKNPELHKINFFNKLFYSETAIQEYNSIIDYVREKAEEARRIAQFSVDCKLKRLSALSDLTGKPMAELLEAVDSADKKLIDMIKVKEDEDQEEYVPQSGDYYWTIMPYKRPQVVLDEPIEYSKDGPENQEIVVISHGAFNYTRIFGGNKNFSGMPLELIGVTIFGKDVNKNYLLFTSSENLRNMTRRENKEYYKKVLLSPFLLDEISAREDRFLPDLSLDEDGNASLDYEKELSVLDIKSVNAIRYANRFPGQIGRQYNSTTLNEMFSTNGLYANQLALVEKLRKIQERSEEKNEDRGEY